MCANTCGKVWPDKNVGVSSRARYSGAAHLEIAWLATSPESFTYINMMIRAASMIARLAPSVKTVTHPSSSSAWRLLPSPAAGLTIAPAASAAAGDTGTGSRAPPPPAARAEAAALAARFAAASTWLSSPPAAAAEMAAAAAARVTAVLRLRSPERSWPACRILTLNDCRALGGGDVGEGGVGACAA